MALALASFWLVIGCDDDVSPASDSDAAELADAADSSSTPIDAGDDASSADVVEPPLDMAGSDAAAADAADADAAADATDAMDADVAVFPDVAPEPCVFPNTDPSCPDGPYGPGSFVNSFHIVENNACCRDFNGDGFIDNKVGSYISLATFSGVDVNTNIADQINVGALIYLFEYQGFDNPTADANLSMAFLNGVDATPFFADNLVGTGDFLVSTESFQPSGAPWWPLGSASVLASYLTATNGSIDLEFPGLIDGVRLRIEDVRIEAEVAAGADLAAGGRVALNEGTLSGALPRDVFFTSLNKAALGCGCIGHDVFERDGAGYSCSATMMDLTNCQLDPTSSAGCTFLADRSTCNLLAVLSTDTDVDLDGDGATDAYSIGVQFTAVGAALVGEYTPQ